MTETERAQLSHVFELASFDDHTQSVYCRVCRRRVQDVTGPCPGHSAAAHDLTFARPVTEGTAFCRVCKQEITSAQWAMNEACPGETV